MDNFDFKSFFATLSGLPQLTRTDPRKFCISRTQFIGSLLHDHGIKVGRAWIMPIYESDNFYVPFYDQKGKVLQTMDVENGRVIPFKWRYHCSTILPDLPHQPVIDFPLFNGPIALQYWFDIFVAAQQRCTPKEFVPCELRVVTHPFADIPQRQVLRYNPQAEKQNKLLPLHKIAKLATLPPYFPRFEPVPFTPLPGKMPPGK